MYGLKTKLGADDESRELPGRVSKVCECPLNDLGAGPRCTLRRAATASTLRNGQREHDLFREISRIVAKGW